jgi:ribosomal subunit interface protein
MKIQIRFRGMEISDALTEYAIRRIHQHLSRFDNRVSDVTVRFTDVNGPKGGADKRCQLTVSGPRLGTVNLTTMHWDLYSGLDLALDRLDHVVGRSLERARVPQPFREARSAR